MKCLYCNKEVSGKAKYCGDACRMAYGRKAKKQPEKTTNEPEQNTKPNTCEEVEHSKTCMACDRAIEKGEKNCGQKYYLGVRGTHIERYHEAMC